MSEFIDLLSSDGSETPPLEEIYNSRTTTTSVNNNKYLLSTDSDSDLPELDFIGVNKHKHKQQQHKQEPCSSLSSSELCIRSLVPHAHVAMVTKDFHTSGDLSMSINRYFDGALLIDIPEPVAKQPIHQSDSDSQTPEFIDNLHDNTKPFRNASVNKFGTKSKFSVSRALFLDTPSDEEMEENIQDFSLDFSPLSSGNTTPVARDKLEPQPTPETTPTTTTDRKCRQDTIYSKQKQIDRLNKESQFSYIITTTKCFDKHLLARVKAGIKVTKNNVTFEQSTSDTKVQSLFWVCHKTEYALSELNEILQVKRRLECPFACVVLSMIEFSERYQIENGFLEQIISDFSDTKFSTLIYGVGEYFSHLEAGDMPRATFDTLQIYYQIKFHLTLHVSNTILQASDILVRIMRGVKGLAHKRERVFSFATHSPKKGRSVHTPEDQRKVWKHQLYQFPRVSEQIASAIADRYPTPGVLISAYKRCESEVAKRHLLKNILVNKRRIGTRISERIYLLFHCTDTAVKI